MIEVKLNFTCNVINNNMEKSNELLDQYETWAIEEEKIVRIESEIEFFCQWHS